MTMAMTAMIMPAVTMKVGLVLEWSRSCAPSSQWSNHDHDEDVMVVMMMVMIIMMIVTRKLA